MAQNRSIVQQPKPLDILCGKCKVCVHHPGSKRFRDIIEACSQQYATAQTKYDKMTITREIYERVSANSRFLKYDEDNKVWEELGATAARDKIGHSLRFASRSTRRKKNGHKRTVSSSSYAEASSSSTATSESSSTGPSSVNGQSMWQPAAGANGTFQMNAMSSGVRTASGNGSPTDPFDELIASLDLDIDCGRILASLLSAPKVDDGASWMPTTDTPYSLL